MAWCEFSFTNPTTKVQIKNQGLWLNSFIRIDNKPILNVAAMHQEVRKVNDIVNRSSNFLSYSVINERSNGTISFLQYYGICDNFNVIWKCILRSNCPEGNAARGHLAQVLTEDHIPKFIYNELSVNPYIVEEQMRKWEQILNT